MSSAWIEIYQRLLSSYGPQHWWPGESPFEVMTGAVLTQNTAWGNVEKAIANLREAGALSVISMHDLVDPDLAQLIRPAGYFNVKARRLKALCGFLIDRGVAQQPERLGAGLPLEPLRRTLLEVHGIGEETADSILLYALERTSFVVDAYTRRIFTRLGLLDGDERYAVIRARFQQNLPEDRTLYNEYHALIVQLGKSTCRPRPRCASCPLEAVCPRHGVNA